MRWLGEEGEKATQLTSAECASIFWMGWLPVAPVPRESQLFVTLRAAKLAVSTLILKPITLPGYIHDELLVIAD